MVPHAAMNAVPDRLPLGSAWWRLHKLPDSMQCAIALRAHWPLPLHTPRQLPSPRRTLEAGGCMAATTASTRRAPWGAAAGGAGSKGRVGDRGPQAAGRRCVHVDLGPGAVEQGPTPPY